MKIIYLLSILCLFLAMSCSSTNWNKVSVDYVYDPEVDLAELKSYDWLPVPSKNIRYPLIMKQIKHEMNRQLTGISFKMVADEPDFLIALHGGIQAILPYEDWQYLQENYEKYALKRRIDMMQYTEDTLIFDFIDPNTGELIYRATATALLSFKSTAEKREKKIHEAVVKVLDRFIQIQITASSIEK